MTLLTKFGEKRICREHRIAFSARRCPKCEARKAWSDRVYAELMQTQAEVAHGSITKSLIREERYA